MTAASRRLSAAACLPPPVCRRLSAAACLLPPACCRLPAAACLLPPACCRLPATACLLPPACCRLPAAACLLPPACYSLPAACPVEFLHFLHIYIYCDGSSSSRRHPSSSHAPVCTAAIVTLNISICSEGL